MKPRERLTAYLAAQGLRSTRQRDEIFQIFLDVGSHVSADELYHAVKRSRPGIGFVTVYRSLKLFAEAGIALERRFEDGVTRYEYIDAESHHDHLICTKCAKIIEFENGQIEKLQDLVARRNRFFVQSHKLELYGLCERCRKKDAG